jgi:transposase, IS6 family
VVRAFWCQLPRPGGYDFSGVCRWVQKYAPELDRQTRWCRQVPDGRARSGRVGETCIRVGGQWGYLYGTITAGGQTLDFYFSPRRNVAVAKRFLVKALRSNTSAGFPWVISTDKAPALAKAIFELKAEGICPSTVEHRQVKCLGQRAGRRPRSVETDPGPERSGQEPDVGLPDVEGDGGDALMTEGAGGDVCLRSPDSGRGDRQPGVRGCLRTPTRSECLGERLVHHGSPSRVCNSTGSDTEQLTPGGEMLRPVLHVRILPQ